MSDTERTPLLVCERENCDYAVYGADPNAADELMQGHLRQHDDPEGWKAEQEAPAEEEV